MWIRLMLRRYQLKQCPLLSSQLRNFLRLPLHVYQLLSLSLSAQMRNRKRPMQKY